MTWTDSQKSLIKSAIEMYENKRNEDTYYLGIAEGLALAAYILSWDDILERYQQKDAGLRYSELDVWLKEKGVTDDAKNQDR